MASFHRRGYGFSNQFTVKATAKKMAKSIVGNSMRRSHPLCRGDVARVTRRSEPEEATARQPWWGRQRRRPRSAPRLQGLDQLGKDLVHVTHDAAIGHREDGGVLVLVDGHDVLRALHAHEVLRG